MMEQTNKIRKIVRKLLNEAFGDIENPEAKRFNMKLSGIAKIKHAPYGKFSKILPNEPWFAFLIFNEFHLDEVIQKIKNFEKESDYELNFTDKNDAEKIISQHGLSLYRELESFSNYSEEQKKFKQPHSMVVFFTPKQKKIDYKIQTLYHTTFSPDVKKNGIIPGSNIKFNNRIYLWKNLKDAQSFAYSGYHGKTKAWIYKVDVSGYELFSDPEEQEAFYVKGFIPKNKIELVQEIDKKNQTDDGFDISKFFFK